VLPAIAVAATVSTTAGQKSAVIKAFGDPNSASACLTVRSAASNHRYATVRPIRVRSCRRWAFDGVNVLKRVSARRWKVIFEGSSYSCPLARIPRKVQRDLGVCPRM
jgi:hypothetical protein